MELEFNVKATIEIFPNRVDQLMNTPESPVGRLTKHAASVVLNAAIPRIGDRYSGHHGSPRIRDTGQVVNVGGSTWAVEFNHPIAFLHHEGARSHSMPSKSGRSRYYRAGPGVVTSSGDTIFGPTAGPIGHPGSPGNPFLRDAAEQVGLRASGQLLRGRRIAPIVRIRV